MKTKILFLFAICCMVFANLNHSFAQCQPMIKIDGNNVIADETNSYGVKLPFWLKTGQTLAKGQNVYSLSVIEFTVNGSALDYSQNLSVTTVQTVPTNKVWKIEAVIKDYSLSTPTAAVNPYNTPGTYTFSPSCNGTYRVQVWGGGGGGAGDDYNCGSCSGDYYAGGGGGGGGYSDGTFDLVGGTVYTIIVGIGGTAGTFCYNGFAGTGGTSSVSPLSISATGGTGGKGYCSIMTGGTGGIGTGGLTNSTGGAGANGIYNGAGGKGGDGAGGGGVGGASSTAGTAPGGGGGGRAAYNSSTGFAGGAGKVIISKSAGGSAGSSTRDKLQVAGVINATVNTSCGYVVPAGYVFRLDGVTSGSTAWLYMSTACSGSGDRGGLYVYSQTYSGATGGTVTTAWPYPMWFVAGTYFYYSSGSAYIHGVEYTID